MKLILAVVPNDDSINATSALTHEGFIVTRLSTTGGFLMVGNTTLLIGTGDDRIDEVKNILRKYCAVRKQVNASTASYGRGMKKDGIAEETTVGGATMFVLNVEEYDKI